jgi:hypothetical protein
MRSVVLSMISLQSLVQSVASLSGATDTGIKRIVLHRGSASGFDPPRSPPEPEPRLLKITQLKENIPSYLQAAGQESNYWPVISAESLTQGGYYPNFALWQDFLEGMALFRAGTA